MNTVNGTELGTTQASACDGKEFAEKRAGGEQTPLSHRLFALKQELSFASDSFEMKISTE